MRHMAIIAVLSLALLFGCIAQPGGISTGASNLPDKMWYSGKINATGVYGNISLSSATSRHVYTIWTSNGSTFKNTTTFTITTARTGTNSTPNVTTDTVANTTAVGAGNWTLFQEYNKSFNMTVTTTSATFNNTTGTFEINILGAYLGNDSYPVGIYLYATTASDYVYSGYNLPNTTYDWTNITGLDKSTYLNNGVARVMFYHPRDLVANSSNSGISIDYVGYRGNYTYDFGGSAIATIVSQTSLDNTNWFDEVTTTNISSTPVRIQVNNTALYARFSVTVESLIDPAQDGLYIQYVGVSN